MNDYQRYLAGEFAEEYEEGRISRRQALKLIASITGSLLMANSILAACTPPESPLPSAAPQENPPAASEIPPTPTQPLATSAPAVDAAASEFPQLYGTVSPDDLTVQAGDIQFPGEDVSLMGALARPNYAGAYPVVLVCHENRGLNDHIRDVTRRLAKAGYVALAVDLLSRQGGSEAVGSANVPGALGSAPPEQFIQDFRSGWRYLGEQDYANTDLTGMVGFCFGGGVTWRMAVSMPELKAAVPYYGPHPPLEDVPQIQAAVLAIYGALDERINQGIPDIETAMQANEKTYEKIIYPDAGHAFHNDTGSRYNRDAAEDAWLRTLGWFNTYLLEA